MVIICGQCKIKLSYWYCNNLFEKKHIVDHKYSVFYQSNDYWCKYSSVARCAQIWSRGSESCKIQSGCFQSRTSAKRHLEAVSSLFSHSSYLLWLGVTDVCHLKNWHGGSASWCHSSVFEWMNTRWKRNWARAWICSGAAAIFKASEEWGNPSILLWPFGLPKGKQQPSAKSIKTGILYCVSYLYHLLRQFHFVVFERAPKFQVILRLVRKKHVTIKRKHFLQKILCLISLELCASYFFCSFRWFWGTSSST